MRGLRTNIQMSVRRDTTLEGAITSATQEQKNYNLMMGVPLGASRDIGGNGYGRSSSMGAPRAAPVGSYPTAMPGSGVYAQPAASAASVTPLENTLNEMKDMISTFRNAVDDRFRSLTSDVNTLKKAYNEREAYLCSERGYCVQSLPGEGAFCLDCPNIKPCSYCGRRGHEEETCRKKLYDKAQPEPGLVNHREIIAEVPEAPLRILSIYHLKSNR